MVKLVDTETYLNKVVPQKPFGNKETSTLTSFARCIHEHPILTQIAKVIGIALSAFALLSLPFTAPLIGSWAILQGIAGALVFTVSTLAIKFLDLFIPPNHNMKNHVFKPVKVDGAELSYQNDVPVVVVSEKDPFKKGQAQGLLMADSLHRMLTAYDTVNGIAKRTPNEKKVPHVLTEVAKTIPQEYVDEMKGLVDGYNEWAKKQKKQELTFEKLLLTHLLPDSCHFNCGAVERALNPEAVDVGDVNPLFVPACTVVVDRDPVKGVIMGRNMDWPTFNEGKRSFGLCRKSEGKLATFEVTVPGFIGGTLTGTNESGLNLAMNVCAGSTLTVRGMPAVFFVRYCLENFKTVKEVEAFVESGDKPPLGAFHLTASDQTEAAAFHFYQSDGKNVHTIRRLQDEPLIVTNQRYGKPIMGNYASHMHHSFERNRVLDEFFKGADSNIEPDKKDKEKLIRASLGLKYVNNLITAHTVMMGGEFSLQFNNAYSGSPQQKIGKKETSVDVKGLFAKFDAAALPE